MSSPPCERIALVSDVHGNLTAYRAVLEDIVDHTNVGAMFRSAAALGVDADRALGALRVSMGRWTSEHDVDAFVCALEASLSNKFSEPV